METIDVINGICSHLEYLGYEITRKDNMVRAEKCPSVPRNVRLSEGSGGIIFSVSFTNSENAKSNRQGYLEWVNLINKKAALITAFIDEGDILVFAGWFPKIYDKQVFGAFFQLFRDDINKSLYGKDAKTDEFLK